MRLAGEVRSEAIDLRLFQDEQVALAWLFSE
jgi:hypothetical protein